MVPKTDHVGVAVTLEAMRTDTLGRRLEVPTPITTDNLRAVAFAEWDDCIRNALGRPPSEWNEWARQAEAGLSESLGVEKAGQANRDKRWRCKQQGLTSIQGGMHRVGATMACKRLRLQAAKQHRW